MTAADPLQTLAMLSLLPPEIAMDELKFFGGLAAITTFVIALLVYFGRKLSKAAERNADFIDLPLYVTRSGTTFFACVVAFWVYCVAVRVLTPHSALGEYLGTFDGKAAVIFGSIMFVTIAWAVSDKLGCPFAKWGNDSKSD
jgi:NADH:ubiquinone oxidoreductase subunit 3 (subunit A)